VILNNEIEVEPLASAKDLKEVMLFCLNRGLHPIPEHVNTVENTRPFKKIAANLGKIDHRVVKDIIVTASILPKIAPSQAEKKEELKRSDGSLVPIEEAKQPPVMEQYSYFNPADRSLYILKHNISECDSILQNHTPHISAYKIEGLPDTLEKFSAITLPSNKVYIIGGFDKSSNAVVNTIYEIDQTNKKAKIVEHTLQTGVSQPTLVANNEYIFVLGGALDDSTTYTDKCQKINIANMQIESIPSLNEEKCEMSACILGNFIYVFGGELNIDLEKMKRFLYFYSRKVEILNLSSSTAAWEVVDFSKNPSWFGCGNCAICPINNRIVIFGGHINNCEDDCYESLGIVVYNPQTKTFEL